MTVTRGAGTDAFRAALLEAASANTPVEPDLPWPTGYSGAYAERRRTCGFQLYDAVGIAKSDRDARKAQMLRNYALFDAPHVAIVTAPSELGPYGAMDCGGFVTAFTLAATALGVASIPQAAIAAYAPLVREVLDLPEDRLRDFIRLCRCQASGQWLSHRTGGPLRDYRLERLTCAHCCNG